jgi:hypothetical protein
MQSRSDVHDPDLAWIFNDAPGDLGLHAAALEPTVRGSADRDPISERQVEAASRHRRISEALGRLDRRHQRALELAHVPLTPALLIRWAALGPLASVTASLVCDPASLVLALADLGTAGAKTRERRERGQSFLDVARTVTEELVQEAMREYRAQARQVRREHDDHVARRMDARIAARMQRASA